MKKKMDLCSPQVSKQLLGFKATEFPSSLFCLTKSKFFLIFTYIFNSNDHNEVEKFNLLMNKFTKM